MRTNVEALPLPMRVVQRASRCLSVGRVSGGRNLNFAFTRTMFQEYRRISNTLFIETCVISFLIYLCIHYSAYLGMFLFHKNVSDIFYSLYIDYIDSQ